MGKQRKRQKLKKFIKSANYEKTQARSQLTIYISVKFEVRHPELIVRMDSGLRTAGMTCRDVEFIR